MPHRPRPRSRDHFVTYPFCPFDQGCRRLLAGNLLACGFFLLFTLLWCAHDGADVSESSAPERGRTMEPTDRTRRPAPSRLL
ncbi:hypothetical protein FM106_24965 [Brachybacterium faecium]|nr:hypothetical protein FM106_24965 [Brachybacterium faecium]